MPKVNRKAEKDVMKSNTTKLEKALKQIYKYNNLNGISKSVIPHIPVDDLQQIDSESLKQNWNLLPYEKQCHLSEYLPCQDHYNKPWHEEHIDGPPPAKKDCYYCENNETRL